MDLKSYQAGRTDGLQLALRLVKEGGTGGAGKRNQIPQSVRNQHCHDGEGAGKGVSSYQGNDH